MRATPQTQMGAVEVRLADAGADAAVAPSAMPLPSTPSREIRLPSTYREPASEAPVYYEGEGCSGDVFDSEGSGGAVFVGDDDDDDSSSTPSPSAGDDDDDDDDDSSVDIEWGDDDDDDDDDDTTASYIAPQSGIRGSHARSHPSMQNPGAPAPREHSPVSRLALLGVLIAFPLRRRRAS